MCPRLPTFPRFTRRDWFVILAVGILTPLIDSRVEVILEQYFYNMRNVIHIFDYSGGPVNNTLLVAWEEYGCVLAAYLVRKPGAATIAMTINGFGQFIVDGYLGPHHLLYAVTGVGADVVFALFRYKRFDIKTCAIAGIASQAFWIPVTYAYHQFYLYPPIFIETDMIARAMGGIVGDGLMGMAIGVVILRLARQMRARTPKERLTDVSRPRMSNFLRDWKTSRRASPGWTGEFEFKT